LQAEQPIPVEERVRLIESLVRAGVSRMEVCSFVSPKAVPSMAGGAEVVASVPARNGLVRAALVPNLKGAQLALGSGVEELTVTISASAAYSEKNTKMTIDEALASVSAICAAVCDHAAETVETVEAGVSGGAARSPLPVDVIVSCAFGSPYEGDLETEAVADVCERALAAGATQVTLADTTGVATPRRITALLDALNLRVPQARGSVGLHLHDTRGTALVNAYAAMQAGVRRFDTSVGGLGGSPFAAGSSGNLATEDLVHLCDDLGVATGIDLDALLEASALVAELIGHAVPSRVSAAGPRSRRAGA
jgi:hydroxymethylglutaryl-CoA lyase